MESIKIKACTDQNGTTAYNLLNAAKELGFDTAGYKLGFQNLLENNRVFPMIAQTLEYNRLHFVVIYEVGSSVILMDPAYGKKILTPEKFCEIWTNNILELYPKRSLTYIKNKINIKDILFDIIKKEKNIVGYFIFTSITYSFLLIVSSYYFKLGLDYDYYNRNYFMYLIFMFFTIAVFKCIFNHIKNKYSLQFSKNLNVYLYKDFIFHIFNLPSKTIKNKSIGELVSRLNDLNNLKNLFVEIFLVFFLDFLIVIVAIPVLFNINMKLFITFLLSLLCYFISGLIYSFIVKNEIIKNKIKEQYFNTTFIENLTSINTIKNLNKTEKVLTDIEMNLSEYILNSYELQNYNVTYNSGKYFIDEVCNYLIYSIGIYEILSGNMLLSTFVLFTSLMNFLGNPIKNIVNNIPVIFDLKHNIYHLVEFLNIEREDSGKLQEINDWSLNFIDVSISYNNLNMVIENLSLEITFTNHVLISGGSGCGKSTLCKTILKENDYSGKIFVGNLNLKDISIKTIRNNVVYVSQKEYLYSKTILENIDFFRNVKLEKIVNIANICMIDKILEKKKLGYETFIEMDSNNFSGGEKQRIVLARALLNEFNVLILDEALSEVDYKTEIKIIANLKSNFKDKTIIYVSHKKLSRYFERVINIDEL